MPGVDDLSSRNRIRKRNPAFRRVSRASRIVLPTTSGGTAAFARPDNTVAERESNGVDDGSTSFVFAGWVEFAPAAGWTGVVLVDASAGDGVGLVSAPEFGFEVGVTAGWLTCPTVCA